MASPGERKTLEEMLGEFLREAAVLVLVFGFLDAIMRDALTFGFMCATLGISAFFLASGIVAEVTRRER